MQGAEHAGAGDGRSGQHPGVDGLGWPGSAASVRPPLISPLPGTPDVVRVYKTEEKGSGINFGVHLVRDAALRRFDVAGVLTKDTDLCEPIRIVTQELGLPVHRLAPAGMPAVSLVTLATSVVPIAEFLHSCHLSAGLLDAKGRLLKPARW